MGEWQSIALFSGVEWPAAERRVSYRGLDAFLLPETDESLPTLAAECPSGTDPDAALSAMRGLLSALSWTRRSSYPEFAVIGSGRKLPIGKAPRDRARGWSAFEQFGVDGLPDPGHPDSQLGLALYREGLNANSIPYKFLCLYKVINILGGNEVKQVAWINARLASLSDPEALRRANELRGERGNIGKYLYLDCRCAVAHAKTRPLVNPEDPRDLRRLRSDLPLMTALAEHAIEHEIAGGLTHGKPPEISEAPGPVKGA